MSSACLLRGTERTSLWSLARVARYPFPQRITANLLRPPLSSSLFLFLPSVGLFSTSSHPPPRFFSSLRLSLYFLSRIFLRSLYLSRYPPPLSRVLSSSTWFKWRLSALLEAAEEARSFRSVSSHTYSSLLSRLFPPVSFSLSSSPVSSSIFSFSPEAGLTFSLEHSPL